MRVLIAVEGTRGDVHPMLELARSLQSAGHGVRMCAPPDFEAQAALAGIEFWPMGESVQTFLTAKAQALHSRGPRFFAEMDRYGRRSLELQFRLLPEAACGMDCVIAAGTVLAAASAAELHRIPYQYVAYTPALLPSAEHSPFCSRGCKDRDLLKWLGDGYAIPGPPADGDGLDSNEGDG